MKKKADIYIEVLEGGSVPKYASIDSAGADLIAAENVIIRPFETKIIPLNIKFAIPSNMEVQIRARSGLSLKTKLRLANSVGTIDADYRDVVGVIAENTYNIAMLPYQIVSNVNILKDLNKNYKKERLADYLLKMGIPLNEFITEKHIANHIGGEYIYIDRYGNPYGTIYISKGDKIAQMIVSEYHKANFIPVTNVELIGNNRGGGYGHTGLNDNSINNQIDLHNIQKKIANK